MQKVKIEKNTVQETLIVPLYSRKMCSEKFPEATVVNLGCGLDETGKACDNGFCHIINIDFPDIIEIRKQLIAEQDREKILLVI